MKKFYKLESYPSWEYETIESVMHDANLYDENEITIYEKQDDTDWYKKGVYVRDGLGWQYVPWKYYGEIKHLEF